MLETQPAAIQLRYLQTLTEIGAEKNTTIVFPLPIDIINAWVKSLTAGRVNSGDRRKKRRRRGVGRPAPGGDFLRAGGDVRRGFHAGISAGPQPVRYAAPGRRKHASVPAGHQRREATRRAAGHSSAEPTPAEPPSDWDFYHSAEPEKPAETLPVEPKPVSAPAKSSLKPPMKPAGKLIASAEVPNGVLDEVPGYANPAAARRAAGALPAKSLTSPLVPRGASVLQVAALVRQADALALAQALQKKKFPAFVLDPPAGSNDHFFRVQVGPYADGPSANVARQKLEGQGFKSIIKR